MGEAWRTIDFRPAPPGWRIVGLCCGGGTSCDHEPGWFANAMPGWLLQERARDFGDDPVVDYETATEDRDRRVVPAFVDKDFLGEVEYVPHDFWYIAGPGDPDPTAQDVERERQYRAVRKTAEPAGGSA